MSPPRKSKKRVLVVDDEPAVVTMISDFLRSEGFETLSAVSAADAQTRLEESQVDAMLLDIQMPQEDGLTFLKRVKERYTELPVVMLTGAGMVQTALQHGAAGYVKKNTDLHEMADLLRRLVR